MNKIPVSVVVPVKNEAHNIGKCLECLKEFTEILVVDSASTDNTLEIVRKFNVKIIDFNWNGRYPKKRNWVLQNYNFVNDWILFVDADEYLTIDFINEIQNTILHTKHSAFWLNYSTYFLGRKLRYGDRMRKIALFKKSSALYEKIDDCNWSILDMEVHEHPIVNGTIGKFKSIIDHQDFGNLTKYINKHNFYASWEAHRFLALSSTDSNQLTRRQRLKYLGIKLGLSPIIYFFHGYVLKLGFLDGKIGLNFALYKSFYYFMIQTKITELKK